MSIMSDGGSFLLVSCHSKMWTLCFPVECLRCKAVSDTFDPFLDISLEIEVRINDRPVFWQVVSQSSSLLCRMCSASLTRWSSLSSQNNWAEKMPTSVASVQTHLGRVKKERLTWRHMHASPSRFFQVQSDGDSHKRVFNPPQLQCAHSLLEAVLRRQRRKDIEGAVEVFARWR